MEHARETFRKYDADRGGARPGWLGGGEALLLLTALLGGGGGVDPGAPLCPQVPR